MTTPGDIQCHVTCAARVASSSVMLLITSLYIGIIPLQVNFLYMLPFIVFTANKCILLKKTGAFSRKCIYCLHFISMPLLLFINQRIIVFVQSAQQRQSAFKCTSCDRTFCLYIVNVELRWKAPSSEIDWFLLQTLWSRWCYWAVFDLARPSLAPVEIK